MYKAKSGLLSVIRNNIGLKVTNQIMMVHMTHRMD